MSDHSKTLDPIFDPIDDAVPKHGDGCNHSLDPDCCDTYLAWQRLIDCRVVAYNFAASILDQLSTATERIAALERCVEIADRVAIDADSIERYHEMNGCEEDAVNYSEPCPQCALKRNRDRYRAAREAVGR